MFLQNIQETDGLKKGEDFLAFPQHFDDRGCRTPKYIVGEDSC